MKPIKIVLALIVVITGIISLKTELFLTPYMLLGLGILYGIDSVELHKQGKKSNAIFMSIFSLAIIVIGIFIFIRHIMN